MRTVIHLDADQDMQATVHFSCKKYGVVCKATQLWYEVNEFMSDYVRGEIEYLLVMNTRLPVNIPEAIASSIRRVRPLIPIILFSEEDDFELSKRIGTKVAQISSEAPCLVLHAQQAIALDNCIRDFAAGKALRTHAGFQARPSRTAASS